MQIVFLDYFLWDIQQFNLGIFGSFQRRHKVEIGKIGVGDFGSFRWNDAVEEDFDEQLAFLAANNSGLDFLSVPTKVTGREVIEILDDDKEDVLNEYEWEEVLVKIKPDQTAVGVGATTELESDVRRSGLIKIANRQFKDYELYTTVEEEEQLILATVDENPANDEEDEEVLAAVAHFIMVHYKEKDEENYHDNEEWDQVHKNYFLAYHQAKAHARWCASRPDEAEHLNRFQVRTWVRFFCIYKQTANLTSCFLQLWYSQQAAEGNAPGHPLGFDRSQRFGPIKMVGGAHLDDGCHSRTPIEQRVQCCR